ncbi:MAG: antibiotic biosynthesis monooxygenase [Desulfobacterales bacterium]
MIVVCITMNALPEKNLELLQTLASLIGPTENETGCWSYTIACDIQDENCFNLLQKWDTRKGLDHHIGSQRFGVLLGSKGLLCEPPQIQIHTVSRSEGMEAIHAVRDIRS